MNTGMGARHLYCVLCMRPGALAWNNCVLNYTDICGRPPAAIAAVLCVERTGVEPIVMGRGRYGVVAEPQDMEAINMMITQGEQA